MKSITKIVIKSVSGFITPDYGYEDKLTITSNSISYKYRSICEIRENPDKAWRYKTDSEAFKKKFEEISRLVLPVLEEADKYGSCYDATCFEFKLTFSDKSKLVKDYVAVGEYFEKLFVEIKKLLPKTEPVPIAICTREDYQDE